MDGLRTGLLAIGAPEISNAAAGLLVSSSWSGTAMGNVSMKQTQHHRQETYCSKLDSEGRCEKLKRHWPPSVSWESFEVAFCTFAGILASLCTGLFLCRAGGKIGNMWGTAPLTNFAQPLGKLHLSFPTTTVYECRIHSGAKCNSHTWSLCVRSLSSRAIAFLHFCNSFWSLGALNRLQVYLQLLYPDLQPGTKQHLTMSTQNI